MDIGLPGTTKCYGFRLEKYQILNCPDKHCVIPSVTVITNMIINTDTPGKRTVSYLLHQKEYSDLLKRLTVPLQMLSRHSADSFMIRVLQEE